MDNSNQNSSDSIIGNCLSCQGLVRVPSRAPSNSKVRCPHCAESYFLHQVLNQAVPELELIVEPIEEEIPRVDRVLEKKETECEVREAFVVPTQLSKGARRTRRRRSTGTSSDRSRSDNSIASPRSGSGSDRTSDELPSLVASSQSTSNGSSHVSGAGKQGASSTRSNRRSGKRRNRNPTLELAKVVIGGLLAVPIAYLLVFWMFKQDPLNIGPKLGNVAPFLVPAEFRGAMSDPPDNSNSSVEKDTENSSSEFFDGDGFDPLRYEPDTSLPIPDVDPDRVDL